jgi:hypothetical protein
MPNSESEADPFAAYVGEAQRLQANAQRRLGRLSVLVRGGRLSAGQAEQSFRWYVQRLTLDLAVLQESATAAMAAARARLALLGADDDERE